MAILCEPPVTTIRKNSKRKTASHWLNSIEFDGVIIQNPIGWQDQQEFVTELLTIEEFIWKLIQSKTTLPKGFDLETHKKKNDSKNDME